MITKAFPRFYSTAVHQRKLLNRIRLEPIHPNEAHLLISIACTRFVEQHPMAKSLCLSAVEVSPWLERIIDQVLEAPEYSVKLFDHENDTFVGLRLNTIETPNTLSLEEVVEKKTKRMGGNAKKLFTMQLEAQHMQRLQRNNDEKWLSIQFSHLDPLYKGRGLGGLVTLGGINYDRAQANGIKGIEVISRDDNSSKMYEKLGFKSIGTLTTQLDNLHSFEETFFLDTQEEH